MSNAFENGVRSWLTQIAWAQRHAPEKLKELLTEDAFALEIYKDSLAQATIHMEGPVWIFVHDEAGNLVGQINRKYRPVC